MDSYSSFIYKSRYSRWLGDRRENWDETVNRYLDFITGSYLRSELFDVIYNLEVMPSMRAMWTAGPALERCNVAGYNCSYLPINHVRAFDELMYILMCGTGVGYSVERQYINELPTVSGSFTKDTGRIIQVGDSKAGWSRAFRQVISSLYSGVLPRWDVSGVRPAGSPLKTFGGRSSGPEPLEELFEFTCRVFSGAVGRRLTSLEVHDICCKVADIVVVGGVRRSAMISLSNLSDERMRHAKSGQWWESTNYRALANNSAVYTERPEMGAFIREWSSLYESKSGERGIFNRDAARFQALRSGRRTQCFDYGTNPCSEIILRPNQFCNLSEVVVREYDTRGSISDKVRLATVLGTYQARLTNFKYLRKVWQSTTEDERLLGVSLTGIYDNPELVFNPQYLTHWKATAIRTNEALSKELGIAQSAAITCIKPSGTVSQLVDSSSGCHPRYDNYYIRTVRGDNKDPLTMFLKNQGVPNEPAIGKEENTTVFSFYIKAPEGSIKRTDLTALDHLEDWKFLQTYWCEHKPSCTINVKEDEWLKVGAWVYENFNHVSGLSFLPYDTGIYKQAPYQTLTEDEYNHLYKEIILDWSELDVYEKGLDTTKGASSMACSGDVCEIVDIST